ncbi:MAG: hypothetical protein U0559_10150 [Anaerolineae bacterium]
MSGLGQVQGSMELKGGIVVNAQATGPNGTIADVVFSVSNVAGGQPIDFTSTVTDATYIRDTYNATGQQVVQIEYRDERQRQEITNWAVRKLGYNDGDNLLEERELFEITVPLNGTDDHPRPQHDLRGRSQAARWQPTPCPAPDARQHRLRHGPQVKSNHLATK